MVRVTRSTRKNSENKEDENSHVLISSDSENDDENVSEKSSKSRGTTRNHKTKARNTELHLLSPVTPPKQKKGNAVDGTVTPSSLLRKLSLISPKKSTRAKVRASLFKNSVQDTVETKTTKKPQRTNVSEDIKDGSSSDSSGAENCKKLNHYQSARKALNSNFPKDLPGRENEIQKLTDFIFEHLNNSTSGSVYISGPPGTGKTASLNLILQQTEIALKVQKIYINCTAIKSATAVYSRLAKELNLKSVGKSEKENLSAVEKYLQKKHKTVLLVLDEIDQLETKNHSILYTIFEWPSKPNSKLILVGIANALDLTDRTLPRLQARCELKPELLHFAPYTKEQIIKIFSSRLEAAGVLSVFTPIALQMLAAKVASVSGDVRRALDIGRRVVELLDQKESGDVLKSVENFTDNLVKDDLKTTEDTKTKSVNLKEVVSVLNNVYGTTQNLNDDSEESFPLQQKIVICSLLLMLKKAKNKDITVGKLHEVYSRVCSKQNLMAVDQAEFFSLCSLIETKGIIKVSGRKEPRMHKVNLEWNETEVAEALKDKQLMSVILQDESCLGKR